MTRRALSLPPEAPFRALFGVGGIGVGLFFALEGNHTLGRNESRPGKLLDSRDYCKLHIIAHYVAVLLGADPSGHPFHALPIGRVGQDSGGDRMCQEMAAAGMDLRFVTRDQARPTPLSICFIYPDGSGGNITADNGAASALTPEEVEQAGPLLATYRERAVALAAPEVPLGARRRLLELATRHDALRVAAFASAEIAEAREMGLLGMADLVALNEDEAAALVGRPLDPLDARPFLDACARILTALQPRVRIILSAGRSGAWAYDGGTWDYCPAAEVAVAATGGAGDALLAGALAGLVAGLPFIAPGPPRSTLAGRPLASAFELGVLLAAHTVTSPHTIDPRVDAPALRAFARELGVPLAEGLEHLLPG